jgi:hypothetical protein
VAASISDCGRLLFFSFLFVLLTIWLFYFMFRANGVFGDVVDGPEFHFFLRCPNKILGGFGVLPFV